MKLTNPTTQELSNAVAEHVAGWHFLQAEKDTGPFKVEIHGWFNSQGFFSADGPAFASSISDVLPLLEKGSFHCSRNYFMAGGGRENLWCVHFLFWDEKEKRSKEGKAEDSALARAVCIALLRAHGHEITTT